MQVSNLSRWKRQGPSKSAAAKPMAAPSHEPRDKVMEGGDKKFYIGQHRNETYSEVAKKVEFIKWLMDQGDLSMQNQDFLTWFSRYYTIQDGSVHARASLGVLEKSDEGKRGLGRPTLSTFCAEVHPV